MRRREGHFLGKKPPLAERSALDAPPPRAGEVIRTSLPDTFDGIRFEIGRMSKYVQEARGDQVVIDAARLAASHWARFVEEMSAREGRPISAHNSKVIQLEGIDVWCRQRFCYVNDPASVEVIQTPARMIRQTRIPRDVLRELLEPLYRAMEKNVPDIRKSYQPPELMTGDCDEAALCVCAMAAALEIVPVKFRFGGWGGTLHHVWGSAFADGQWYDSDLTEPGFKLGDFSEFEHYEEYEIPV